MMTSASDHPGNMKSAHQTHLIQLISSLVKTPRPEIDGSDRKDVQNVYCWCASRNHVGKRPKLLWLLVHGILEQHVQAGDRRLRSRRCGSGCHGNKRKDDRDATLGSNIPHSRLKTATPTLDRPSQGTNNDLHLWDLTVNLHALSAIISLSARNRTQVLLQL